MTQFLEALLGLGCKHPNTTWPRTNRNDDGVASESYVRCNDCGEKINFNVETWERANA